MPRSPDLDRIAHDQWGVAGRRQLAECGVTPGELRWKLGRSWRQILPGVVLLGPGLPTTEQRHVAALLYAGPKAWLAGPTALRLHGVTAPDEGRRVQVLVPTPQRSRDMSWVSVRRTGLDQERVMERGPLRWSSLPRALIDAAAAAANDDTARVMIIEAVQRRLVRLDDLAHWIEVRRPNGRRRLRQALTEAAVGAWSLPEADLARLLSTSRVLPSAWANPQLKNPDEKRLTTPDLWLDDVGMAIMVQSQRFHAGVLQWDATVESCDDLSASRVIVIGVTPTTLERDPAAVLARIETAYVTARRSGTRAPVIAVRRTVLHGLAG